MDAVFSGVGSIIPFFLLIGVVVTVHELGHYAAGRFFGAAAESFAVGFGRSVFERTDSRGTRWRLNWLPIGGFVKFVGEPQTAGDVGVVEQGPVGKPYSDLAAWQRAVIALGGPAANFVFAAIVFAGLAMFQGVPAPTQVRVVEVFEGTPSERAGFVAGDEIVSAGGRAVKTPTDVMTATQFSAGEDVVYEVRRAGEIVTLTATPERERVTNEMLGTTEQIGRIGLRMSGTTIQRVGPIDAMAHGVVFTGDMIALTTKVLIRIATFKEPMDQLRGPVGIFDISDKVTDAHMKQPEAGFFDRLSGTTIALITLAAMFSVGVGYFNLLPIPVLDGGHVVACVAEMITKRQVPEIVQRVGLSLGLASLACFALAVTWNDLKRIGVLEVFSGLLS